ncbi:MAG: hypothetical protein AAGF79_18220 [Pseudomonadota bacterium]
MGKVLKDLFLALFNATLILIALCLFLAWQISQTAAQVVDRAADAASQIQPVTVELDALRTEVAGLRSDLETMSDGASDQAAAAAAATQQKLDDLQARIDGIQEKVADLRALPDSVAEAQSGEAGGDPRQTLIALFQMLLSVAQDGADTSG